MNRDFCFSVLALKPKYQLLAKDLAKDLEQYSPGTQIVIGTDNPTAFADCSNVIAFRLEKAGILHCYHDKRFVMEQALSQFKVVIQLDADVRMVDRLPEVIEQPIGLGALHVENLVEHVQYYTPDRLPSLQKLADKLSIDLHTVSYVGESLITLSAGAEQASAFFQYWNAIARYLELNGIHAGEGNAIGLAAAKSGLEIMAPDWLYRINEVKRHYDASTQKSQVSHWERFKRRADYHYRFNKAKLTALREFSFFYR